MSALSSVNGGTGLIGVQPRGAKAARSPGPRASTTQIEGPARSRSVSAFEGSYIGKRWRLTTCPGPTVLAEAVSRPGIYLINATPSVSLVPCTMAPMFTEPVTVAFVHQPLRQPLLPLPSTKGWPGEELQSG